MSLTKVSPRGVGVSAKAAGTSVMHIPPQYFIHVLDCTSNITRVEIGPQTFVPRDDETIVRGPDCMVKVPPGHYCVVANPVVRHDDGTVVTDVTSQVKIRHADLEIRLSQEPFPLYPGEDIHQTYTRLQSVLANSALLLRALVDFEDASGQLRCSSDEWLFEGPATYIPRTEEEVVRAIQAVVIRPNQAVRFRARKECVDRHGLARVTGEEWMVREVGAYLPGAFEEVVDVVDAHVLTDKTALHVRALETFTDAFGKLRKTGEEWLVTAKDTDTYIPSVFEQVVGEVAITVLSSRQYCVVVNPWDSTGHPRLGHTMLVKGESSFFLRPGESLLKGVQPIYVLSEDDGLILRAIRAFQDGSVMRKPGERWLVRGPLEYVPPVDVEVVTKRRAIPLDVTEGIYVRNIKTGKVRAISGTTYMLTEEEELWEKQLPERVEQLIFVTPDPLVNRYLRVDALGTAPARDKTRVITYFAPHNSVVQIYDFRLRKERVAFGPQLVMLGPDELMTRLSMSGGQPKVPNQIKALCLLLGPDYCADRFVVETADHARLSLSLCYNWHFDVGTKSPEDGTRLFSIPDFTGDMCNAMASRIRGAVAHVSFDHFHKNSDKLIRSSVFGMDAKTGQIRDQFRFKQNGLIITGIDIESVEPVDQRTRDALVKSVQLAIEITTNSQEAAAKHVAERLDQEAQGKLLRQKLKAEAVSEKVRCHLVELQAESSAVESCGQTKAEAQSRAEAARVEGLAAVEQARLKAEAVAIDAASELERLGKCRAADLKYTSERNRLELAKAKDTADIEATKFKDMVQTIGPATLTSIANAGPELQVRMLQGLGLESTLITDGSSPINLFNTASGLLGGPPPEG